MKKQIQKHINEFRKTVKDFSSAMFEEYIFYANECIDEIELLVKQ